MVTSTNSDMSHHTAEKLEVVDFKKPIAMSAMQMTTGFDMQDNKFFQQRVHFIGIGGSGMCGLAQMLAQMGSIVSGSDRAPSAATQKLEKMGVAISYQQTVAGFPHDAQYVVHSAAVKADHPELSEARHAGVKIFKYAQLLGHVMQIKHGIAIAGTHGKSTTTSMVAYILSRAGMDPSYIIGASSRQLGGSSHGGSGDYFIAEACEFDRSFLNLYPRLAAVTNIESDHLDYYHDIHDITAAFGQFMSQVHPDGVIITSSENQWCLQAAAEAKARVETYGLTGTPDWLATDIQSENGRLSYEVSYMGHRVGRLALRIPGRHNIGNSLVAAAMARHCHVPWDVIASAIEAFTGADRRSELLGQIGGITILDDYAHHPTEIRTTLAGLREFYQPERLICVFQPHQHSRTRSLLEEFSLGFAEADMVVVPDIYVARDTEADIKAVNAQDLVDRIVANGRYGRYIPTFPEVVAALKLELKAGDLVVSMGAGPVWEITHELVRRL